MPEAFLYLVPGPETQVVLKSFGFSPTGFLPSKNKSYGGCHITIAHPLCDSIEALQCIVDAAAAAGPINPFEGGAINKQDPNIRRAEEAAMVAGWPEGQFKNYGSYHCAIDCYMQAGSSPEQAARCHAIIKDPHVRWGFILSVKTSDTSWTFDESTFRPCVDWLKYPGLNCYPGYDGSAVWFESDMESRGRGKMTLEQAQQLCIEKGGVAFTYDPAACIAWPLKEVHPSRGQQGSRYDLYVNKAALCEPSNWQKYSGLNCYPAYQESAVWIESDGDSRSRGKLILEQAQKLCIEKGGIAFTYDPAGGIMWPLKEFHPSRGQHGTKYDLYASKIFCEPSNHAGE